MSTSKALAEWTLFLETKPPNTSVKIQGLAAETDRQWHFKNPQIQLHCEYDDGPRRFDPTHGSVFFSYPRDYKFITYQCRDCEGREVKAHGSRIKRKRDGDGGQAVQARLSLSLRSGDGRRFQTTAAQSPAPSPAPDQPVLLPSR